MNWKRIRWGAAFGGMLVAELSQIAAAFGWVVFYSYVVHPGESPDFYRSYAQTASPWVSAIAGPPIFYFVCRWIGSRAPARAWPTAMALFALFVVVELAVVVSAGTVPPRILAFMGAGFLLKFLACHLGAKSAARSASAEAA